MPIVRLSRDKRGLDTLYLIDTRQDGRSRGARVLYFWTAPPGLRVGRNPLDASRQRALEQAYPDVDFDWPELTRAAESAVQQAAALSLEARREPWRAGGGARASRSGPSVRGARATPTEAAGADAAPSRTRAATAAPAEMDAEPPVTPDAGTPTDPSVPPSESDGTPSARSRRRRRRARRPGSGGESPPPDL